MIAPSILGKLKRIDLSNDTSIAAGNTNEQTLTPPAGTLYKVINMYYNADDPAGSSAGTHELNIKYDAGSTKQGCFCRVAGNTGTDIYIGSIGAPFMGIGDTIRPASVREFTRLLTEHMIASNSIPISFYYQNDTDVAQAQNRALFIWVLEYPERA